MSLCELLMERGWQLDMKLCVSACTCVSLHACVCTCMHACERERDQCCLTNIVSTHPSWLTVSGSSTTTHCWRDVNRDTRLLEMHVTSMLERQSPMLRPEPSARGTMPPCHSYRSGTGKFRSVVRLLTAMDKLNVIYKHSIVALT